MQVREPFVQVHVWVPVVDATVYLVIALPPVVGLVHVTVTSASPAVTVGVLGFAGFVGSGVTELDGVDAGDVPEEFLATTLNV